MFNTKGVYVNIYIFVLWTKQTLYVSPHRAQRYIERTNIYYRTESRPRGFIINDANNVLLEDLSLLGASRAQLQKQNNNTRIERERCHAISAYYQWWDETRRPSASDRTFFSCYGAWITLASSCFVYYYMYIYDLPQLAHHIMNEFNRVSRSPQ